MNSIDAKTITLSDLPAPPVGRNGFPWNESVPLPDDFSKKSGTPLISIVTPSYNQGEFIEETIRSVLLQGYPNLEYIVIDGGSTDDTVDIIRKYEPWISYWVSEPDQGQSHAIQKGLQRCTGHLWNWLNSDDVLEPGALWAIANAYQHQSDATIYAGLLTVFGEDIKPFLYPNCFRNFQDLVCVWTNWPVPQPALFLNRLACLDVGGVDSALMYGMDYELYLRLTQLKNYTMRSFGEPVARIRRHPDSKTVSQHYKFCREILQIFDDFSDKNNHFLPQGWKKSRDLFAYITDLKFAQEATNDELSLSKFLKISWQHKYVWKYRYFWGALRRQIWSPVGA